MTGWSWTRSHGRGKMHRMSSGAWLCPTARARSPLICKAGLPSSSGRLALAFLCFTVVWTGAEVEADDRLEPPSQLAQDQAERALRKAFQPDYSNQTPEGKRALAKKLLEWAPSYKNDAAKYFVVLGEDANGELLVAKEAKGDTYQSDQRADLMISSGKSPVPGVIDEIRVWAYERDEMSPLPGDVDLSGLEAPIRFDRNGRVQDSPRFVLVQGDQKVRLRVAPGGIIE